MRFVKRRGSSRRRVNPYLHIIPVMTALLAIAVLLGLGATLLHLKPTILNSKVDPRVIEAITTKGWSEAYIAFEGGLQLRCKKEWHFGKLTICKTVLTSIEAVERLANDPRVLSIYAAGSALAPAKYLSLEGYEEFNKTDIDNVFHKAFGPWCGRGVVVAIIDTGIDYTHPDFYDANNKTIILALVSVLYVANGHPLVWIPYVNGTMEDLLSYDKKLWMEHGEPAFLDINGHGTHVAGIIAGRGWASNGRFRGIAPCTKLVVIKAFNRYGEAGLDTCLSALEWVYNHAEEYNISILNLSWGASFASDGNDPLSLACDRIYEDKHVWVFAAAGNEGNFPTTIVVPAVAKDVVAVGAWDPYYDRLAPFSSLGPTVDMRMKPDFVAAGVFIVSTASQYASFPEEYMVGKYYVALSGTSMATPVVAGIAADFIEYHEYWYGKKPSLDDFLAWELVNGRKLNPLFKDFISGYGIPLAPHS